MRCWRIRGGVPLKGQVTVSGAKNAALPILVASLLTDKPTTLSNIPNICDIQHLRQCLVALGKEINQTDSNTLTLSQPSYGSVVIPKEHAQHIRASILLLAPLIARHTEIILPLPGGCNIGTRPIDQHLMAIRKFGVDIIEYHDHLHCVRQGKRLQATTINFDMKTVTGTENAIMAAVLAKGISTINNAACEPEIQDLIHFLNTLGAKIKWLNNESLEIIGVSTLSGCENYSVIGDRIEAGTFLVAAAMTGGSLSVKGVDPAHLSSVLDVLKKTGAHIFQENTSIHIEMPENDARKCFDLTTAPYPGFPTDLQSVFLSLGTTLNGESKIVETLFENRFRLVDELKKMNATVTLKENKAMITGPTSLIDATVKATDLRAGAALVCAALATKGLTQIIGIENIERGYENMDSKLRELGANIKQIDIEDHPISTNIHRLAYNSLGINTTVSLATNSNNAPCTDLNRI